MTRQTWFITGSSRGFGRALATAALEVGDQVVATARRPEQLADLVERYGDRVLATALDITDADAAVTALDTAVKRFGRVDVVVNNAGYANTGPIETMPVDDFRAQIETNFWGVYNVCRAAAPVFKMQGGGIIVQFSSIGGRVGHTPGLGAYQAAKFAVDGFTRVLATETAPFGIRFLTVEPGGFATDWAGASMEILDIPKDYQGTVGATAGRMSSPVMTAGDPVRAGEILVGVVKRDHLPTHLLLGASAVESAIAYSHRQIDEATTWEAVSKSADFDRPYPADLPADVAVEQPRSSAVPESNK
jgi:NAD(P)-dependent dehydrogenase (short-subunit alcohol dehydrogenase family)